MARICDHTIEGEIKRLIGAADPRVDVSGLKVWEHYPEDVTFTVKLGTRQFTVTIPEDDLQNCPMGWVSEAYLKAVAEKFELPL